MSNKTRISFFDNARFLLMVLVVFGHLLQPFTEYNQWYNKLYLFIYTFHMPAFIFISGYFSDSFTKKENPISESFYKLIIPYVIFQWVYSLYYYLIGTNNSISLGLLVPNWSLWFLVSLFFWQLSLYFFNKVSPAKGIAISILLSLIVGYFPFVGRELTLQRTFVFLPYYVIGYYINEDSIRLFINSKGTRWFSLGLIIVFLFVHYTDGLNKYLFFGSQPYEDFLRISEWGALISLFSLLLGFLGIAGFLSLVSNKENFFTNRGENTLTVYLFHGFIIQGLRAMDLPHHDLFILGLLILLIGSFVLTFLLSSQPVSKFYNKLTGWVQRILRNKIT